MEASENRSAGSKEKTGPSDAAGPGDPSAPPAGTSGSESTEAPDDAGVERGGIDVFDGVFVRQPVRAGHADAVRGLVADWVTDRRPDGTALVPVDGVNVVTLFLEPHDDLDRLLWYLELRDDDVPLRDDPAGRIRASSPLFDAGLDEYLTGEATVQAHGVDGHQQVTHATHPRRQRRFAERCDRSLIAPVVGDDLPIHVAVATFPLKPGLTSRIAARAVALGNWIEEFDPVHDRLRDGTRTLEAEAMYTETLLFEPVGDRQLLHYYMETESEERLYEAYERAETLEVRFSDWVTRHIFEDPAAFLEPPMASDGEVLVHAVDPERP